MNGSLLSLLNAFGGSLCAEYRYNDAEIIFRHALSLDDSIPEINKNLGDCYYGIGKFQDAVKYLRKAIALRNDYHRAYGSLGSVLRSVNKPEEALRLYKLALSHDAGNLHYRLSIAMCYIDMNMLRQAEIIIDELAKTSPSDPDIAKAHSIVLGQRGEIEKSRDILRDLLKTEKYKFSAFSSLSEHKDLPISDDVVEAMEDVLISGRGISKPNEKLLCFGLWRVFDKRDEREKAFRYLRRGNEIVRNSSKALIDEEIAYLDLISTKERNDNKYLRTGESVFERPIFVIGMPRSGSSLIEQILSAHSEINPGGETLIFPRLLEKYSAEINKKGSSISVTLSDIRREYLSSLNQMIGYDSGFFTDKTLSNFMNIRMIFSVFPNAKIVHIKRGAMDNCFACYATDFKNGHFYTSDLDSLGRYYKKYIDIVKNKTLDIGDDSFIELQYENVVSDMENEISRLLGFLGLDWQESCRRFFESKNQVATASYYDVRRKISTKSINRWSRYADHLKPLSDALDASSI